MELNNVFQDIHANDGWGMAYKIFTPRFIDYAKKSPVM